MKILVVSNLYPPHFVGGYELGCRDVVEGLRRRGHTVQVLAGNHRNLEKAAGPSENGIERVLQFEGAVGGLRHHRTECGKLHRVLKTLRPDLVYFWNQQGLSRWLPLAARWYGYRVVFFLFDASFVSWRVGALLRKVAQRSSLVPRWIGRTFLVEGWPVIRHQPCHFGSEFLRQTATEANVRFDTRRSAVIRWGIDASEFTTTFSARVRWPVRQLLYVGQISPLKGVHTAIKAFAELTQQRFDLRLTLVGGCTNPEYKQELHTLVQELGLADRVEFRGKIERSLLAPIFGGSDLLIFPSEWAEPFGITRLEAMAAGLAVVGTTTGGSGELLRDRETAFTFQAGNAADCARVLREACADRALFEKVRSNGHREVLAHYTLDGMLAQIDSSLDALTRDSG